MIASETKQFKKITTCELRTYDHYAEMIKKAKESGYKLGGFGSIHRLQSANKAVILRHDIDFALKPALRLAGLEDVLEVSATYFISIHRPHYSPLTSETRKTVHSLIDHGHEIGLHYEPEFDDLQAEISMLEHYLDCKLVAIARHNPFGNHTDVDNSSKPTSVIDAYGSDIMKEFKYLSDSSGIWREGCFCGWVDQQETTKFQLLIHPIWWSQQTEDPVLQLQSINATWTGDMATIAEKTIQNLKLHREKIQRGEV